MRIILNSDVIFSKDLRRTGLPGHVIEFLQKCAAANIEVVIPETTLIEFEKEQAKARATKIADIEKAAALLKSNGIKVEEFSANEVVPEPKLISLLDKIEDLKHTTVEASLAEYKTALRKACLREPPHPPDTKSDEMRDLLIWETSLGVAANSGGAILISKDEVHTHHRGDQEATEHDLLRTGEFDVALEMMNLESTSGAIIRNLMRTQWDVIVNSELPLVSGANIASIRDAVFTTEDDGRTHIECIVTIFTGDGNKIACDTNLSSSGNILLAIDLIDTGSKVAFRSSFVDVKSENDYEERLNSLRRILD